MIAIIVPVLGRPAAAEPLAANVAATTTVPHRLVFVCSPGDDDQIRACEETWADTLVIPEPPSPGDFARKILAAYRLTDESWIFQAADDIEFTPGWAEAALAEAERTGALVVGTNDDANPLVKAGRHATHSLIARSYCANPGASMDGPGTVFSEAYGHQFCDNELYGVAVTRGVWAFAREAVVRHRHWVWGTAAKDSTYERGDATSRADARIFRRRQRLWTRHAVRV